MNRARALLGAAGAAIMLSLAGCGQAPAPSPTTTGLLPSPTVALGPNLTTKQFAALVASGKLGERSVTLKDFAKSTETDPDNEGSENEQESEAVSCVKMRKIGDEKLVKQAADDAGGAVVQLFSDAPVVVDLFTLNQKCAAEEAEFDSSTAVTTVSTGQDGSAMWWLTKDPEGLYQATIGYGNVLVFVLLDGPDKPTELVASVKAQIDQLATQ